MDNFGVLEKEDIETFDTIDEELAKGGMIYFAVEDHGAKRLFILSNNKLKAAVHIYEKCGFKEIKLDDYEYVRGDIAFERLIG